MLGLSTWQDGLGTMYNPFGHINSVLCKGMEEEEEGAVLEDPNMDHFLTAIWTLLAKAAGVKTVPWLYQVVGKFGYGDGVTLPSPAPPLREHPSSHQSLFF